jgi:hypothetical protein
MNESDGGRARARVCVCTLPTRYTRLFVLYIQYSIYSVPLGICDFARENEQTLNYGYLYVIGAYLGFSAVGVGTSFRGQTKRHTYRSVN